MASVRCNVLRALEATLSAALLIAALSACSGGMTQTPTPFVAPTVATHPTSGSDSDADSADTPETSPSEGAPISKVPETTRTPNAHASTKAQPSQHSHRAVTPSPHAAAHAGAQCPRTAKKTASLHCTAPHGSAASQKKHATCKKSTQTGKAVSCK
jgi:hypothetical protein